VITISRTKLRAALLLALVPGAVSTCFGFAEIARGALLLQTTGSVTYDSYFLGSLDNDPDVIYTVFPSLRYSRKAGRASIATSAGIAFNRYDKNTDVDSDDLRADITIGFPTAPGSRLDGNFNASYNEATTVDYFLNDRVATKTFAGALAFNYQLATRVNISEALRYSSTERKSYSDQDMLGNTLEVRYSDFLRGTDLVVTHGYTYTKSSGDNFDNVALDQYANDISLGLSRPVYGKVVGTLSYGYTLLHRSSEESVYGDTSSSSSYVSLSLDGPFLPARRFPKLTSSASLSYRQPAMAGVNDSGGKFLSGNMRLAWAARERTNLHIDANRSLNLTANDYSIESTRVSGGFDERIGRSTTLSGSAGYNWTDTRGTDRSDSRLDAGLSLSRSFNKYFSASLGYTYEQNDTTSTETDEPTPQFGRFAPRDYDRHTATASVTVTF
jgi:outer membrane protein assembly factor BamA